MALKVLMLRKKKENKQKELDELRNNNDFETREKELEAAVNELDENATEEEKETVENEVNQFEKEKREFEEKEKHLEQEIKDIEEEIKAEEEKQPKPDSDTTKNKNERRAGNLMETRDNFFGLNMEQRTVLFQNEEVKSFMSNLRSLFGKEKRSTKNIELTIPVNFLPMIKQIIEENSKLLKYTNLSSITGTGRIIIMGTYAEG